MDTTAIIQIENLSFNYGSGEETLKDINLNVKKGEFLGIIGPNGSGKSTLLKIILGLLKPTQGTIRLFGKDLNSFKNWSKIGYVPQKVGQFSVRFPITVEEVVSMNSTKNNADKALKAVNMYDLRKKLITQLSGGQQQRVFIARALAGQPELLVLDEPTVGIDIDSQVSFYELLKELNQKRGLTLILVSHDIDVVAHEVETVACINQTMVCHGRPKDLLKGDFVDKLYGKHLKLVVHQH